MKKHLIYSKSTGDALEKMYDLFDGLWIKFNNIIVQQYEEDTDHEYTDEEDESEDDEDKETKIDNISKKRNKTINTVVSKKNKQVTKKRSKCKAD